MKNFFSKTFLVVLLVVSSVSYLQGKEAIKILAIGNSFSQDAAEQYLYELAEANGDSLVIGNAYIGGCPLDKHLRNAKSGEKAYQYRKIVGGEKKNHPRVSVLHCITDDNWDYITIQQSSPLSGLDSAYWPMPELISYIKQHATNPNMEILFHQTWAYAQNSGHKGFKSYGDDQMSMYKAIVKTVKKQTKKNKIRRIIPCGTAIQNGRTSFLGDNFCRDGYHLSLALGRYTAACTWLEVFTGKSAVGNTYVPSGMTTLEARVAQRAAHEAVRNQEKVTSLAAYTEDYTILLNQYYPVEQGDKMRTDKCLLDLYYPKNQTAFPTVVWFHGGGLTGGSKYIPHILEEKGIAVVSAGYRLSPKSKHPSYLEDAAAAVNWTKKHIAEYGGDPSKIVVAGHSAGAYLTAMLALDTTWLGKYDISPEDLYMFHPMSAQCVTHYTIREEKGLPKDSWWMDEYSPVFHARKSSVPLILTTGQRDLEMSLRYEENLMLKWNLERFGHEKVQLHELKGKDHGSMVEPALELLLRQLAEMEKK